MATNEGRVNKKKDDDHPFSPEKECTAPPPMYLSHSMLPPHHTHEIYAVCRWFRLHEGLNMARPG